MLVHFSFFLKCEILDPFFTVIIFRCFLIVFVFIFKYFVEMKLQICRLVAALLATVASAAPAENQAKPAATPKVYLAGDSTMAIGGGGAETQGHQLPFV